MASAALSSPSSSPVSAARRASPAAATRTAATPAPPVRAGLPALEAVRALVALDDVEALRAEVRAREAALDAQLRSAASAGAALAAQHVELLGDTLAVELRARARDTGELAAAVERACALAETVSQKVKQLDATRSRVKEARRQVEAVIGVKECIVDAQRLIATEDFDAAAQRLEKYLHIDESVLEGRTSAQLRALEARLHEIVARKLREAGASDDVGEVLRYCVMLKSLGKHDEGLAQYVAFLRDRLSLRAEQKYRALAREQQQPRKYLDAISALLEDIAEQCDQEAPIVESKFGPAASEALLREMQGQCDVHATKLLARYLDARGLELPLPAGRRRLGERSDLAALAELLEELSHLSQSAELFDRFMRRQAGAGKLSPVSEMGRRMQEVMGAYIALEEVYMREGLRKALEMDSIVAEPGRASGARTTTVVDHAFFVFMRCTRRAVCSCNVGAACAVANLVFSVMNNDYIGTIDDTLKEKMGALLTRTASVSVLKDMKLGGGTTRTVPTYSLALNNLQLSVEYVAKLRSELERDAKRWMPDPHDPARIDKRIISCLEDLDESAQSFQSLLQSFVEQAWTLSVAQRVKALFAPFERVRYALTEADFAACEVNDPFVVAFIAGLDRVLAPFGEFFTPANFVALFDIVLRFLVLQLEAGVLRKQFTQFGALQFDKELRHLQDYFGAVLEKTARGKFVRLTQIAALLCLERIEDVLDYWGDSSAMSWRLTPKEVRAVLALRAEFTRSKIDRLDLVL